MKSYSVIEEITLIRSRYLNFFGIKSFSFFYFYIIGFMSAEFQFNIEDTSFSEREFNSWLLKKYGIKEDASTSVQNILLTKSDNNEGVAFDLFFCLLDEYSKESERIYRQ